jgi:hypothetical protein
MLATPTQMRICAVSWITRHLNPTGIASCNTTSAAMPGDISSCRTADIRRVKAKRVRFNLELHRASFLRH